MHLEHPEMFIPVPIYMTILVFSGWAVLGRKISESDVLASTAED
jgi:hypothetical protein